jgi:catechol 2,3-dioxygenase
VAAPIDPRAGVGVVSLTVRDLAGAREFYQRAIGLGELAAGEGRALLGAGGRPLVELVEDRGAPPRPRGSTGLFHLAILVPDRAALARSLQRLIDARWTLQGASDHLVSEALYVSDPEGNGIEIYRDRRRAEWRRDGDELRMATLPLDLSDLLGEPGDSGADGDSELAPGARLGHVHLNVADLAASERFYAGLLGLGVTARSYPGALFLAAGDYHHHVGLNVWAGAGAPPPPERVLGLRRFGLLLPDQEAVRAVVGRVRASGTEIETVAAGELVRDPSRNAVLLTSRAEDGGG